MSGRYGRWVIVAVVATAYLGVGGATAAAASPISAGEMSWSDGATATTVGSSSVASNSIVVAEPEATPSPDAPAADVPVTTGAVPAHTSIILVIGLLFLGAAILLMVRSGSAREVDDSQ